MSCPLVCGNEDSAYVEGTGLAELTDLTDGTGGRTQAGGVQRAEMFRNRVHRDAVTVLNVDWNSEITDGNTARNPNN